MNLKEAYSILEISPSSSEEEVKKKYRELTRKYHPDVNKDPGSEDKIKQINKAYSVIKNGPDEQEQQPTQSASTIQDFLRDFGFNFNVNSFRNQAKDIEISTTISFKEAMWGTKKNVSYKRNVHCHQCSAFGKKPQHNGCKDCDGYGRQVKKSYNSVMSMTCKTCYAKVNYIKCEVCKGVGSSEAEESGTLNIPPGVQTGNILNIKYKGSFYGNNMVGINYSDLNLKINVTPDSNLKFEDNKVKSNIKISLLESLKGCKKDIYTLDGIKQLEIKPKTKNGTIATIPGVGLNKGNQYVNIDVEYPEDVNNLIKVLEDK